MTGRLIIIPKAISHLIWLVNLLGIKKKTNDGPSQASERARSRHKPFFLLGLRVAAVGQLGSQQPCPHSHTDPALRKAPLWWWRQGGGPHRTPMAPSYSDPTNSSHFSVPATYSAESSLYASLLFYNTHSDVVTD